MFLTYYCHTSGSSDFSTFPPDVLTIIVTVVTDHDSHGGGENRCLLPLPWQGPPNEGASLRCHLDYHRHMGRHKEQHEQADERPRNLERVLFDTRQSVAVS